MSWPNPHPQNLAMLRSHGAREKPKAPRRKVGNARPLPLAQVRKTAKILRMLQPPDGASLAELQKATGWQAHSLRGFLSGAVKRKMRLKVFPRF